MRHQEPEEHPEIYNHFGIVAVNSVNINPPDDMVVTRCPLPIISNRFEVSSRNGNGPESDKPNVNCRQPIFYIETNETRYRCQWNTLSSSSAESGKITGRNDSECGQMGVNSMHGTLG